ncbi:hypothetical protein CYY_005099 [Polysphondylium violaceum]|uniref:Eukaryotic translation initiation factor 3 subunit B n=1 Tax=Polysphondylium violaceum TaxID=133409 RepID=A0A8J4PU14_9MYCE|nr:hypothetical protein CYY_005099 [Polysphondylium violaceum]
MSLYDSDDEELVTRLEDFEPPVQLDTSFARFIVIDNVPVAPESKHEKLKSILHKIFVSKGGEIVPNGITLVLDANKNTKGFAFIEYTKKEGANDAVSLLNNYKLDAKHTLQVNLLDDFKKFLNFNEQYSAPKVEEFVSKPNYNEWLSDKRALKGYDQFVVRYGDYTDICWNEMSVGKPIVEKSNTAMTTSYVQWSNTGSYLVTFHPDGVVLYGGKQWIKLNNFDHRGVQLVDFSPEDKYLITFAPVLNDNPKDPKSIIVWDVRNGKKLRGFLAPPKDQFTWPAFRWSAKDRFISRTHEDKGINIYETPSMKLLDNTYLAISNLKDYSWSPTDLTLAYFVPGSSHIPSKITLLELPSKKVLAEKVIFEAIDARFHWQNEGSYLCVKTDKIVKTKKTIPTTAFELFRTHEPNVPVESFEIPYQIKAFAWEPRGKRICIIHGEHKIAMNVTFFEVGKHKIEQTSKLENRKLNTIFWSPRGTFILLANLNDTGELEFYNAADGETLSTQEHLQCTGIDWNPSGRFVTTFVSQWKVNTDTGYNIWSFAGEPIYSVLRDRFYQFNWRPRPKFMLSTKEMNIIKTNYKKYQEKFDEMDGLEIAESNAQEERRLQGLMDEFLSYLQRGEAEYQATAPERERLGAYEDIDKRDEYQSVEIVEDIIDIVTTSYRR